MAEIKKTRDSIFSLGVVTIISFILILTLTNFFFYFLNAKTGSGFGFKEILFALTLTILIIGFLSWIKSLIKSNPYFGILSGLTALVVGIVALFIKYKGPNTTVFAIIASIIIIIYLGFYFFKFRKGEKRKVKEFDDDL